MLPRLIATFLVAGLAALGLLLAAPAPAPAKLVVGISEQNESVFTDARFKQLKIRHARFVLPFDEALQRNYWRLGPWLAAAREARVQPMIVFNHYNGNYKRLPSVKQYRRAVRNVREDFPWVRTYTTWNEANLRTMQPTGRNPRRAAQFYNVLRKECRGCKVVAVSLWQNNYESWLRKFRRTAKKPRIWGFHNYVDANRKTTPPSRSVTARFARAVPGQVWLTEAGGIVRNRFGGTYPGGRKAERRAARAMKRTFALARSHRRIKRLYLYHWMQPEKYRGWDSGLVRKNGKPRPAFKVVKKELKKRR
jgi:hypothetical protein